MFPLTNSIDAVPSTGAVCNLNILFVALYICNGVAGVAVPIPILPVLVYKSILFESTGNKLILDVNISPFLTPPS